MGSELAHDLASVIPAKAGIQPDFPARDEKRDSRFRGNDEEARGPHS